MSCRLWMPPGGRAKVRPDMETPKDWLRQMTAEEEAALRAAIAVGDEAARKTAERELANYRRMLEEK